MRLMRLCEDILDDMEAKSSVNVERLIDKEEISLENWESNAKQNYTHIITVYDNAYEGINADKMIEDDVYRLHAIFDRYFPNHSDVFVSCVSENAMGCQQLTETITKSIISC